MCGIVGVISDKLRGPQLSTHILAATQAMTHRGPDDHGIFVDESLGIGFGHRRLAIIDLSPQGQQPMHSASGQFTIVFNGEIYNYKLLRAELAHRGYPFRGDSDTEVILAAIEHLGLAAAVQRFNGMFAFAVWDWKKRTLHLVRDRLGVKPLYYGWTQAGFIFASELKPFYAFPEQSLTISRGALTLYFRHGYVPSPWSIYEGVYKLQAGSYLTLGFLELVEKRDDFSPDMRDLETPFKPIQYWSAETANKIGQEQRLENIPETIDELEQLLDDCIKLRMISDVPLGVFLSGGVDSSLVTALMQKQSSDPVRTFSIGFANAAFDESAHAALVAKHLGTIHTAHIVTGEDALHVVPQLPQLFDEPFADSSQIPTYLLAKLTKQHVSVALSGDGGDELFAGYSRYHYYRRAAALHALPSPIRRLLATVLDSFSGYRVQSILAALPKQMQRHFVWDKIEKLVRLLEFNQQQNLYRQMHSHWLTPSSLVRGTHEPRLESWETPKALHQAPILEQLMYLDIVNYLTEDILTKVDRATMGAGLEAREPLLDYRLVEFSFRLPLEMKFNNGRGKLVLRNILNKYVPENIIDRPKKGFSVPLSDWLRGPLREWAETLLNSKKIEREEILQAEPIRNTWKNFCAGKNGQQALIWDVLVFQSWLSSERAKNSIP